MARKYMAFWNYLPVKNFDIWKFNWIISERNVLHPCGPTFLFDAEHWSLPHIPKIIVSIVPTNVGSEEFLFLPVVLNHVVNTYPEAAQESLFCVELDEIYMANYHSIGLGSNLLSWALARCQQDCFEKDRVITHMFGKVVPDDDNRLKDVIRFYRHNGFREAYGFIYRMIYPVRENIS